MTEARLELDRYGGLNSIVGTKTGFFHVERIDGRQWLVTPDGHAFVAVALSHPFTGETKYVCQDHFDGDYERYVRDSFGKLVDLGFNCSLSEHTSPERNMSGFVQPGPILDVFEEHRFPYSVGIHLLKHPLELLDGETYPDIFAEPYISAWAATIKQTCLTHRDNPLVLGYYYGYGGLNDEVGLVNAILRMPESSPGRQSLIGHFVTKYGDEVARYNKVYGRGARSAQDLQRTEAPSFSNQVNQRHMPGGARDLNPDLVEDFEALVAMIAVHLYRLGHTEIRRWDPNHLIFGAYLKTHSLDAQTWKAVAPYVDAIAPQHIQDTPDVDEFIRVSGVPAIVSDELFGIVYPDKIRFAPVDSHAWRGRIYTQSMTTVMSNPGMLGVSYCNCLYDQVDPTSRLAVGEQGVLDSSGRERREVSGPIKTANHAAYEMARNCGDGSEYRRNADQLMELWKAASAGVSKDPARQWRPTNEVK